MLLHLQDRSGSEESLSRSRMFSPLRCCSRQADRMFFVRGVEYDSIYLSQFVNCIRNGRAYSLPAVDPAVRINFDEAIAACKRKGRGWHLLTWAEWKYIREHTIPDIHGNTSFGKYHNDETEVGIGIPNCGRTLTGTGPANWFHNGNKETGIADVVGLVWKMIAGLRLKSGVIQYMPDNDAAAPDADLSISSEEFQEVHVDDLPFPDPVRMGANEDGELVITTDKEKVDGWAGGMRSERKTKIRSLVKELDKLKIFPGVEPEKKLHVIFQAAQNSDFLSGRSGKWNGCSFDWLINKTNALKVLEGQYQNKGGVSNAGRTDQRHDQEDVSGSDRTTNEALERFRRNHTGV